VAPNESAALAEQLIADAIFRHNVADGQLTLHSDRGSSMTSRTVSQLLADLGVLQSHSRPHQSNDNPYSEAQFKTLKYFPTFPKRFANIAAARTFCDGFFEHYNDRTRPSFCTPRPTSTSDWPRSFGRSAKASSTPPMPPCPGVSGPLRRRPGFPRSSGSADPRRRPWPHKPSEPLVSQSC